VTELLFSYGTLRQPEVQRATFGREIDGRSDAIVGYDLDYVTITDPHVVATSGSGRRRQIRSRRLPPHHRAATFRRSGVGLRVRRVIHHCDSWHCRL
jgi:hypothetical protein